MLGTLKSKIKEVLDADSALYNTLAWLYGWAARKPGVRRAAWMRAFKDSRFNEDELWMASLLPQHLLDAVLSRYHPASVLDVGCGTGRSLQYMAAKGLECYGLEGSRAALAASPVPEMIRLVNLNHAVDLGRRFDLVWSYEVAEHIHAAYTETFLDTLARHADRIVLSAAQPGQGGAGHFNEQPAAYWIAHMSRRGYSYDSKFSDYLHTLPEKHSRNLMVFYRSELP
jgi:SAM-dependent methyltransferase